MNHELLINYMKNIKGFSMFQLINNTCPNLEGKLGTRVPYSFLYLKKEKFLKFCFEVRIYFNETPLTITILLKKTLIQMLGVLNCAFSPSRAFRFSYAI